MDEEIEEAFERFVVQKWRDALDLATAEPVSWIQQVQDQRNQRPISRWEISRRLGKQYTQQDLLQSRQPQAAKEKEDGDFFVHWVATSVSWTTTVKEQ
jgi:hypothetical protein